MGQGRKADVVRTILAWIFIVLCLLISAVVFGAVIFYGMMTGWTGPG